MQATTITDNVAELLNKILEFTEFRKDVLTENIDNMHDSCYLPRDLEVETFARILGEAIEAHALNGHILLRDTDSIRFGYAGTFEVEPRIDHHAKQLLMEDRDQYLELQIDKLLENSLNRRIAAELLNQHQQTLVTTGN
jgi:hypothetical protein